MKNLLRLCCLLLLTATTAFADDLALQPPLINTEPGEKYSDARRDFAMTIGIDCTPKGRFWAAWVAGGDSELGYFVATYSDDQGTTWKKPQLVIDPTDAPNGFPRRTLVGNFWTDPLGRLWLIFDQSMGYFDGRAGVWTIRCDNPDADKPTWTAPQRITNGVTLNKPIVLKDGTWLLPVSVWTRDRIHGLTEKGNPLPASITVPEGFREQFHELDAERGANVYASNDQGQTWTRRGMAVFPKTDFDEHMMVELKDGRLWMMARTATGMMESYSTDQGHTWSTPQNRFPHINSRFHLRKLHSGNLLLVRHGNMDERTKSRSHLTAFISEDDGMSWKGGLLLDERGGVSYPDGFESPDGRIVISYDRERGKEREILMADFTEADILAGKIVDAKSRLKVMISKATGPKVVHEMASNASDKSAEELAWERQALLDAKQDRTAIAYDGISPNKLVCDTTLRQLPDGSWAMFMLAGDDFEPSPENYIGITRSTDEGHTWSKLEMVDSGFPRSGKTSGQGPTELMVIGNRCSLFFSTHSQTWGRDWKSWIMDSDDNCHTWSKPRAVPGRLADFTFIRNHIVLHDGRIMIPFQHYVGPPAGTPPPPPEEKPWHKTLFHYVSNPRNGVMISGDGGKTWTEHGNIRLSDNDRYYGWAENNIVELSNNRIGMIIRGDNLGGILYYAESTDGGKTWPEYASKTDIPNPGSKATLYPLGNDCVALLHNPNPKHRSPLALWISFDGMKTWPYKRVLVPESCDGPKGRMNYPDGFVTKDKQWLHFGFDDNRHRAVYYGAKLPPMPIAKPAVKTSAVFPTVGHSEDEYPSITTPVVMPLVPTEAISVPSAYQPPGMWIWDNWYVNDNGTWHAFYLQLPKAVGLDRRWQNNGPLKQVGHATSHDLIHWQDQGPALCALPGTWNDIHIATGSITRQDGLWYMAYTGRGSKQDYVGMATSSDLMKWTPLKQNPEVPLVAADAKDVPSTLSYNSEWQGQNLRWSGISDPYLIPQTTDGWHTMILCSRMLGVPLGESGCLTTLRSRDLQHWEDPQIVAWPRCFERMETPQEWSHGAHTYLSFGGVLNKDWLATNSAKLPATVQGQSTHKNYYFVLNSAVEKATDLDRLFVVKYPAKPHHYIMKVEHQSSTQDVALFTVNSPDRGSHMSFPYSVDYAADGQFTLQAPSAVNPKSNVK
jgi:predicted neuraminidase